MDRLGVPRFHDSGMLQGEAALLAVQRSHDALDRGVRRGFFYRQSGRGDHLAFRRAAEIAVKLLVERHPPEVGSFGCEVAGLRRDLDVERSGCPHFCPGLYSRSVCPCN